MSDTFITVIAIMLAAVLIFVVPLMATSDKMDNVSKVDVETLTSNFLDEIKTTGKLTQNRYSKFVEELTSTGNTYDINMQFKILDENPGKKSIQTEKDKIGENVYYTEYTSQIENVLNDSTKENTYILKEGDIASVTVRNTNLTMSQQLKNFFYTVAGNDTYTILASNTGLITTNGGTSTIIADTNKGDQGDNGEQGDNTRTGTLEYLLYESEGGTKGNSLSKTQWTNKDIYVEFSSKEQYDLELFYFWKYSDKIMYTQCKNNSVILENKGTVEAYWKHSGLETYSKLVNNININIDKIKPVIGNIAGSSQPSNVGTITLSKVTDEGGSGLRGYYCVWTEQGITPEAPTKNSSWTPLSAATDNFTIETDEKNNNKKCTVWVIDNAGNISEAKSAVVTNVFLPIKDFSMENVVIKKGDKVKIPTTIPDGVGYKSISFTSESTKIATINNTTGEVTGLSGGTSKITCIITNYNETKIQKTCTVSVLDVEYSPNGGNYAISYTDGAAGTATIKTNVSIGGSIASRYVWSSSNSSAPDTGWTTLTSAKGGEISKTEKTASTNYLWISASDINGKILTFVSEAFTTETGKIALTPNSTGSTNKNVTVTATWPTALTKRTLTCTGTNGTELIEGTDYKINGTESVEIITEKSTTVIAKGDDKKGNQSTVSQTITNIDKTAPTIGSIKASTEKGNTGTITVENISDKGGSGIRGYYSVWTEQGITPEAPTKDSSWTPLSAATDNFIIETDEKNNNKKYTVWVIDNAGNISTQQSCEITGIVSKITGVKLQNAIVKKGSEEKVIQASIEGGTSYKFISFESSNTNIATISGSTQFTANGVAQGIKSGTSTITCTVTNYDGTIISGTCTLTVVDVTYSPNGGTYTLPYNNGKTGTATIKTKVSIAESAKSEYAWSTSDSPAPTIGWTTFSSATGGEITKTETEQVTYYLWVRVSDTSGNTETDTNGNTEIYKSKAFSVVKDIALTPNITGWTNKDVKVTVTWPNWITQKSLQCDGTKDTDYTINGTESVTVKTNKKIITAIGSDTNGNQLTTTLEIKNIDKDAPTIQYVKPNTTTPKEKKVEFNVLASDSASGIKEYKYTYTNENYTLKDDIVKASEEQPFTKTNMPFGVTKVKVTVYDNAGNSKESLDEITITDYNISDEKELTIFRDGINDGKYNKEDITIRQINDIDLTSSWEKPIAYNEEHKFLGTYDGENCTISNLSIEVSDSQIGLFGYNSGIIKNINLKNPYIKGTYYVGGITGYNKGTIYNCNLVCEGIDKQTNSDKKPNILAFSGGYIGGITGYSTGNIEECNVDSGIVIKADGTPDYFGNTNIGGICGWIPKGTKAYIKKCTNNAEIITNTGGTHTGGIVGLIENGKDESENIINIKIESCVNKGNVISNSYMAGGICGTISGETGNKKLIITLCKNTGDISATYNVGGIVGRIGENGNVTIDQSYNTGTITATKFQEISKNKVSYAGGLVGYTNSNNRIQYSYNTGNVKGTADEGSSYVGGITGGLVTGNEVDNPYSTIISCYNIGTVSVKESITDNYYVGGLVGRNFLSKEITKGDMKGITESYNKVTCNKYLVGGSIESTDESTSYTDKIYNTSTAGSPPIFITAKKLGSTYYYQSNDEDNHPLLRNNPE